VTNKASSSIQILLVKWQTSGLALLLFLLACWQFLGAVDNRPMHRDEARWIHRATYVREILHPLGDYWDESTWIERGGTLDERYRLRAQPPMGSYVMGIGFLLQGKPLPDIGFWNMDQDDAWNAANGNQPSHAEVLTARRTSAVVGAITVVAIFLVANRLTNAIGGVVAGLMLTFNPLMEHLATFAGSDAVLALTIALTAVAAYRFADKPTWPRAILLGILPGLGASTKLSPLGITIPLALLGILAIGYRLLHHRLSPTRLPAPPPLRAGIQLLTTPVVALLTLIISYPYLWQNPIQHIRNLIDYRQWGMEIQSTLWQQIAVDSRTDALRRVGIRLGDEWTILSRLGWTWFPTGTELAIACAGLVILLWLVIRHGLWSAHALAAAVLTSETAITIYGLNADWARYHLPILLLTTTCIGVACGSAWGGVTRLFPGAGDGPRVHADIVDFHETIEGIEDHPRTHQPEASAP